MHLTLTDRLTCPACGPDAGLILLADRIENRRVLEGRLGCPSCRADYPIRGGYAELRPDAAARTAGAGTDEDVGAGATASQVVAGAGQDPMRASDVEQATRLAALMGLAQGRGFAVLAGPAATLAASMASLLPDMELVTTWPELAEEEERAGVNRLGADALPFFRGSMRAVALTGSRPGAGLLTEAVRVVVPGGRIVVDPADAPDAGDMDGIAAPPTDEMVGEVAAELESAGARVLAHEGHTVVAAVE